MGDGLWVLQDSRQFVGNDLLFWREGGGYTTDLNVAQRFTKNEALELAANRASDVPRRLADMFRVARLVVDVQDFRAQKQEKPHE